MNYCTQASLSFTISQSLLKFMSIELVMVSNHFILCLPLLLLPSSFPSIRVFSSKLALHIRWTKYWSFSFSTSLSNEYSRLISFGIDWFDLLAVQRTLKSLFQHRSLKASILWHSVFFMVQLSEDWVNKQLLRRVSWDLQPSCCLGLSSELSWFWAMQGASCPMPARGDSPEARLGQPQPVSQGACCQLPNFLPSFNFLLVNWYFHCDSAPALLT